MKNSFKEKYMKTPKAIFILLIVINFCCHNCFAQSDSARKKISLESDGITNYLIFKSKENAITKEKVKGTGFLNFSPDSTLFYYLEKKEGTVHNYNLIALDGNNTSKKITELTVNSKISVNNNGIVVVETGIDAITHNIICFNINGEIIYRDSANYFIPSSSWTEDGKYFAFIFYSKIKEKDGSYLSVKVFDSSMIEKYYYVFSDDYYDAQNFQYKDNIISINYYKRKNEENNKHKKYIATINLKNMTIERRYLE